MLFLVRLAARTQVRDPRVPASDNDAFLDLMESYFGQSEELKAPDARPELAYQVCVLTGRQGGGGAGVCVCVCVLCMGSNSTQHAPS